jgi:glyoxylase-like metal-dependent hydrolase (beta-lactamase superfamily II)
MEHVKIYPINTGEADVTTGLDVFLKPSIEKRTVPLLAFLITGLEKNEYVLVDTGMYEASKGLRMGLGPHRTKQTNPERDWHLIEEIRKRGVNPEEVKYIILTHLHYEHLCPYYIRQLPNARIYIQRKELEHACVPIGRYFPVGGGTFFYDREDIKAICCEFWDRVEILNGDYEILPNLTCVLFEDTHTPGSQAVYVKTTKGTIILTGDLVRDKTLNIDKQYPPAIFYDIRAMEKALAKLRKDGSLFLGSHDYEIIKREFYP